MQDSTWPRLVQSCKAYDFSPSYLYHPLLMSIFGSYKIKERRSHGETGSVDLTSVDAEQQRMCEILARFSKRDRWNFDETSLFGAAPPEHGLATQMFSGKKKSKTRITIGFACNADGSEKMPPFFIGRPKKP
jgi:hypothetical protein